MKKYKNFLLFSQFLNNKMNKQTLFDELVNKARKIYLDDPIFSKNKLSESLLYLNEALSLDLQSFNDSIYDRYKIYDTFLLRGKIRYKLKQYKESIIDYDNALVYVDNDYLLHLNRGNSNVELEKYFDALNDYDNALKINPYNGSIFMNKGFVEMSLENFKDAINYFDIASRKKLDNEIDKILIKMHRNIAEDYLKYNDNDNFKETNNFKIYII